MFHETFQTLHCPCFLSFSSLFLVYFVEKFLSLKQSITNHSLFITGRGIYILYEDVKSCPYEDVQILWSILVESHPPSIASRK